jgi:hypothetical protein
MDLSRLSHYSSQPLSLSDCSDNENQDPFPPNKRMRKSNYKYKRVASFNDLESAEQMIKTIEGLGYHGITENSDGKKIFYLCNLDKLCDARAYNYLTHQLYL